MMSNILVIVFAVSVVFVILWIIKVYPRLFESDAAVIPSRGEQQRLLAWSQSASLQSASLQSASLQSASLQSASLQSSSCGGGKTCALKPTQTRTATYTISEDEPETDEDIEPVEENKPMGKNEDMVEDGNVKTVPEQDETEPVDGTVNISSEKDAVVDKGNGKSIVIFKPSLTLTPQRDGYMQIIDPMPLPLTYATKVGRIRIKAVDRCVFSISGAARYGIAVEGVKSLEPSANIFVYRRQKTISTGFWFTPIQSCVTEDRDFVFEKNSVIIDTPVEIISSIVHVGKIKGTGLCEKKYETRPTSHAVNFNDVVLEIHIE